MTTHREDHRIVIYGNAGSGKTTMARALATELGAAHLDLDSITWQTPGIRKALADTLRLLEEFVASNTRWVIEGCYGDVVEAATRWCTELRFLNPGVEVCVANCRNRPWEPSKFPSKEAQDEMLSVLVEWVRQYETRDDEYGLRRHTEVFEAFAGSKREYPGLSRG